MDQAAAATERGAAALRCGTYDVIGGSGPLQLAARSGNADIVTALLAAGAKVDGVDGNGATALDVSVLSAAAPIRIVLAVMHCNRLYCHPAAGVQAVCSR